MFSTCASASISLYFVRLPFYTPAVFDNVTSAIFVSMEGPPGQREKAGPRYHTGQRFSNHVSREEPKALPEALRAVRETPQRADRAAVARSAAQSAGGTISGSGSPQVKTARMDGT